MDRYEIEVKEELDARWLRRFEGFTLSHLPDGRTRLSGELPDQAALHGALARDSRSGTDPLARRTDRAPAGWQPYLIHIIGGNTQMNSHLLDSLWQNRWAGAAVACGLAALAGLLVAWTMPRGPATATQALIIMALGLAAGLTAGLVCAPAGRCCWRPWPTWSRSNWPAAGWPGRRSARSGWTRPSASWR